MISIVPINENTSKNTGKYETKSPRALKLEAYKRKQENECPLLDSNLQPRNINNKKTIRLNTNHYKTNGDKMDHHPFSLIMKNNKYDTNHN